MVRNLMKAGNKVTVYDVVGTAIEEMATEGAIPAYSVDNVFRELNLLI